MKTINYTGSSKLISRIVHLLNRKAPLPLDADGDAVWGTNGQVLTTDGNGNTSWTTPQGGGGDVTDVEVNGVSVVDGQGVANVTVPTKTSDLNNDSGFVVSSDLATVATSGSYNDLQDKPTIPDELADLTDDSTHRTVTDTQISTWNGKSDFSGSYNDLTDKPTIPTVNDGTLTIQQNGTTLGTFTANQSGNTTVNLTGGGSTYTEGDGIDISAQDVISVDTTFTDASTRTNIASGDTFATILGKIKKFFADLKTVAFTGAYSDLSGTPTIPTVNNGTLTIQKNGTNVQTFSANQSENATANITVPTNTNELTNGAGFITSSGSCAYATSAGSAVDQTARDSANNKVPLITSAGIASCTGNGQYSYFKIATLTITGDYANGPIAFELSQRQYEVTLIQVCFGSTSGTDPSLSYFITNQRNNYWIKKTATSTWEVYGSYSESWGACALHRVVGFRVNNGVSVTVNMTNVSDPRSGATQATYGGNCGYATSAGDSEKLNGYASDVVASANTIVRRNSGGYIYANYYNENNGAENINNYTAYVSFKDSSGWIRCTSKANFRTWLGDDYSNAGGILSSVTGSGYSTEVTYSDFTRQGEFVVARFNLKMSSQQATRTSRNVLTGVTAQFRPSVNSMAVAQIFCGSSFVNFAVWFKTDGVIQLDTMDIAFPANTWADVISIYPLRR